MAGVAVEIQTEGFEELRARLAGLAGADLERVLDQIGAAGVSQTLERFEQERGPDGRPWRPLHAATVLRRLGGSRRTYGKRGRITKRAKAKLGAIKILQDEGTLRDSIHHQVDGGAVRIGTNMEYGAIHQFGGAEVGMPQIPARPYLGINSENRAEIAEIVEDFIREHLK